MKSLNFTHLTEKVLSGDKDQTFRTLFFPTYVDDENEEISLTSTEYGPKIELMIVPVIEIYPRKIKDFTMEEAKRDGFDSIREFQKGVMKINKVKSINRWGMITRWTPQVSLTFAEFLKIVKSKNSQTRIDDY